MTVTTGFTATDLELQVASLTTQLRDARTELAQARDNHRSDIAVIGAMLLEKAEYHDWCHQYDDAVNEINSKLYIALPVRTRTYNVSMRGYIRAPYYRTVTVTVAGDESIEEAAREAMDDIGIDDVEVYLPDAEFADDAEMMDYDQT